MGFKKALDRARSFYANPIFVVDQNNRILTDCDISEIKKSNLQKSLDTLSQQISQEIDLFTDVIDSLESRLEKASPGDKIYLQERISKLQADQTPSILTLTKAYKEQEKELHDIIKGEKVRQKDLKKKKVTAKYAVAIIRNGDDKTLFLYRHDDKDIAPKTWCLPGGHIDDGETPKEAVIREVQEETNLSVDFCWLDTEVVLADGSSICYYVCHIDWANAENEISLLDSEHSQYAFFDKKERVSKELIFDLGDHLDYIEDKTAFV